MVVMLLIGCGGGTAHEHEHHHTAMHEHAGTAAATTDSARWQANSGTTEGIRGMLALVDGYPANGLTSGVLHDSLDARLGMIFARCTMKGEAHEALHHYLLPIQDLIVRLPERSSPAQLDSLREHLRHYDEVFY